MAHTPSSEKFDPVTWTKKLADCIELELLTWWVRMSHDKIRALAIHCHPWHADALSISFLTDRESFAEPKEPASRSAGKWSVADWRMYSFTDGPGANWPFAEGLMKMAYDYYALEGSDSRDTLVNCCADAIMSEQVGLIAAILYPRRA